MPRGFLIKRKKHLPHSWKKLILSEDEQSETGSIVSDPENGHDQAQHGSPDSGFSQSSDNMCETVLDQSMYRKHFAKEWLQRNDVHKFSYERPSSVESSDTDNKDSEHCSSIVEKNSIEDANGNDVTKATKVQNIQKSSNLVSTTHSKNIQEFNNNINNNQEPFALYNRNFALNRYASLFSQKNGMPLSLPPSPLHSNLSINTSMYGSPMYWSAFNRLALSSPKHDRSPLISPTSTSSSLSVKSPGKIDVQSSLNSPAKSVSSPGKRKANQTPLADNKANKIVKRPKSARKISFEEEFKSSPVSGTYIKDESEANDGIRVVSGDIDSSMNCVEITPEAEAELAKIENKIGDFICKLCKEFHENAFALAQHRCSRIVHVEYRCPECDKVFNCPANLASHRRWHKPKVNGKNGGGNQTKGTADGTNVLDLGKRESKITPTEEGMFACDQCGKKFKRQAYLKKHLASHSSVQQAQQQQSSKNVASWQCHLCGCLFKNESERSKHIIQHHSPEHNALLNCGICSAGFSDILALEQHQRCHNADIFSCKYCPDTFYSIYGLGRHMYKCHPSESSQARQAVLLQLPQLNRPC